jgi:hypothetical protein
MEIPMRRWNDFNPDRPQAAEPDKANAPQQPANPLRNPRRLNLRGACFGLRRNITAELGGDGGRWRNTSNRF